jgi:hypothetical protein
MSSLVVLYLRRLGQPLGALATTVPSDPPDLGEIATVRVPVPLPDRESPDQLVPTPITVARDDLAIANIDAEFRNPREVFGWRVITSQTPEGKEQRQLDRFGTGSVVVTPDSSESSVTIDVPKLGNNLRLEFEVRSQAGASVYGALDFGPNDARKQTTVPVSDPDDCVVFVQGYLPAVPPALS